MKRRDIRFLITIVFLIFFTASQSASALSKNFLIKYIMPDKAGKLLFLGGNKEDDKAIKYNVTRLTDPHRMVIDIENAVLEEGKKELKINNDRLSEEIRIAQFSVEPSVVRVVFTADSAKTLDEIKISIFKNNVVFEFDEVKLAKIPVSSVYKDRNYQPDSEKKPAENDKNSDNNEKSLAESDKNNDDNEKNEAQSEKKEDESVVNVDKNNMVMEKNASKKTEKEKKETILTEIKEKIEHNIIINNVEQHKNGVLISGAGIISLAEPFVLESPSRIIFDITEAVLDSADLIQDFTLENSDTLRIAQFDPKTVRIVLESKDPNSYTNAFSPDLQSIIIAPI